MVIYAGTTEEMAGAAVKWLYLQLGHVCNFKSQQQRDIYNQQVQLFQLFVRRSCRAIYSRTSFDRCELRGSYRDSEGSIFATAANGRYNLGLPNYICQHGRTFEVTRMQRRSSKHFEVLLRQGYCLCARITIIQLIRQFVDTNYHVKIAQRYSNSDCSKSDKCNLENRRTLRSYQSWYRSPRSKWMNENNLNIKIWTNRRLLTTTWLGKYVDQQNMSTSWRYSACIAKENTIWLLVNW